MSIFASETSVTLPLVFDAPHTVTIRKLTRRQFLAVADVPETEARVRAILVAGLVAWTYARAIDEAAFEDLDVEASEFIADEILYLARPSLRPGVTEAAAQKND